MWKDKPTGVKILWFWTIGTAIVLFTTVSRTRMSDMERLMNEAEKQQQQHRGGISSVDSGVGGASSFPSEDVIREDN